MRKTKHSWAKWGSSKAAKTRPGRKLAVQGDGRSRFALSCSLRRNTMNESKHKKTQPIHVAILAQFIFRLP